MENEYEYEYENEIENGIEIGNDAQSAFITQLAGIISFMLYAIAIIQLFMTFYFPIGPSSDPTEIYMRNISTVVTVSLLAQFFADYRIIHSPINDVIIVKTVNQLSVISIILLIACIIKVGISAVFAYKYLIAGNLVGFYYAGEVIVWAAVGLFAKTYYQRLQ